MNRKGETTPPTLHDILVACAGATVPCLHVQEDGKVFYTPGSSYSGREALVCECCDEEFNTAGIGRVYVLGDTVRLPCPNTNNRGSELEHHQIPMCPACNGSTWVPNPDLYSYRRAVRAVAKIAYFDVVSDARQQGDFVTVQMGSYRAVLAGDEGLRDQEAEATALKRMLENIPGVELGK